MMCPIIDFSKCRQIISGSNRDAIHHQEGMPETFAYRMQNIQADTSMIESISGDTSQSNPSIMQAKGSSGKENI